MENKIPNDTREVSIEINRRQCTSCGKCTEACRRQVLVLVKNGFHKHVEVIHPELCTGCLQCMSVCRHRSIEVRRTR